MQPDTLCSAMTGRLIMRLLKRMVESERTFLYEGLIEMKKKTKGKV